MINGGKRSYVLAKIVLELDFASRLNWINILKFQKKNVAIVDLSRL